MVTAKIEDQQPDGPSAKALAFEMDTVALGARQICYSVLAGILKEQGITLTPSCIPATACIRRRPSTCRNSSRP